MGNDKMERWAAIIANEDTEMARLITRSLSPSRYAVTQLDNPTDIIATATRHSRALVLADLSLPGLEASDLCRRLEESRAYSYVIFLLQRDDAAAITTAFEAGADDVIAKPIVPAELHARLQHAARVLALEEFRAQLEDEGALFAEISARTHLHSRRYLEMQLAREIARARRFDHSLGLVLAEVLASHGDDRLMREFGRFFSERVRASVDCVARYDERRFAFLLPETGLAGALAATHRLLTELRDESARMSRGLPRELRLHFGVSALDSARLAGERPAPGTETLLASAEAYLQDATLRGNNEIAAGPVPHP